MRPCLAGPQVDHQVPLLEKKTIVLARLSSERKLIHYPKIIVIGTHVASSKMGCPPCYALFLRAGSGARAPGQGSAAMVAALHALPRQAAAGLLGCIR